MNDTKVVQFKQSEFMSTAQLDLKWWNWRAERNGTALHTAIIYSFIEFKKCKLWNETYDTVS